MTPCVVDVVSDNIYKNTTTNHLRNNTVLMPVNERETRKGNKTLKAMSTWVTNTSYRKLAQSVPSSLPAVVVHDLGRRPVCVSAYGKMVLSRNHAVFPNDV